MRFEEMGERASPARVRAAWRRQLARAVSGLAAAAVLAACGGGDQVTKFAPSRVLSFGDEVSVLDDASGTTSGNGRKYSVNALAADNVTLDCAVNPIWVQQLATRYGLTFPQCNPNAVSSPASRIYAQAGARSTDVKAQIDLQFSTDGFTGSDLVTVLVGAHDVLDRYARYPGISEADLRAELEQAGVDLAAQVNRIAATGAKVLIATVPNQGVTPFALAEAADPTKDGDRAALLTRLTERFNAKLRLNILNDGRKIGLLLADELFQSLVGFPGSYGLVNVTQAACTTSPVTGCTSTTLQPADGSNAEATATTWLWADSLLPGAAGHSRLGDLAYNRATGNPF